jgi:flagellar FliL protein
MSTERKPMSKAPAKKADDGANPPGKSKKKLIIIIVVAILALAGIGAGAMMFLGKKSAAPKEEPKKEEVQKAPIFLPLDAFTVNLQSDEGDKYLQVNMTIQLPDEKATEAFKANMPQVKSRMLLLLSSKDAAEILTPEGKQVLIQEIMEKLNEPFSSKGDPQKISGVFFTSFVVQ